MATTTKKTPVKKNKTVEQLEKALLNFTANPEMESIKVERYLDGFIVRVDFMYQDKYEEIFIE